MNRDRPRSPAVVYTALSTVLLLIIAIVAITATQPPPPTVAEFAPQAQDQIEEAPDEQAVHGRPGGAPTPPPDRDGTTPAPPDPIEVPRAHRCVTTGGGPPRQTEDPQSPPCVPFWEGDNGGETHRGVTANEIRIAVPSGADEGGFHSELAAHFNSRYEFYGRQLVLLPMDGGGTTEQMRAAAVRADEELGVFASTQYGDGAGHEHVYYDDLASRGIISVNARPSNITEEHRQRHHPYQWSYLPGFDKMSRNKADWICRSLNGRPSEFADGEQQRSERVFGLVWSRSEEGGEPDLEPMLSVFRDCGVEIAETGSMPLGLGTREATQQSQNIILQMRQAGVTSIICPCHVNVVGNWLKWSSTQQGYFPEWLLSTYMYTDDDIYTRFFEERQVNNTIGISWWSRQLAPQNLPWYWAVRDGDPNRRLNEFGQYYSARWLYNTLLMLAAGIQMAGENLTPETFAQGLMRTQFPNPNSGGPPYYQGHVGFGPNDHSAVNDAAIFWMSKSERSNWDGQPGRVCWAGDGRRYRLGTWPTDNGGLFEGACQ